MQTDRKVLQDKLQSKYSLSKQNINQASKAVIGKGLNRIEKTHGKHRAMWQAQSLDNALEYLKKKNPDSQEKSPSFAVAVSLI